MLHKSLWQAGERFVCAVDNQERKEVQDELIKPVLAELNSDQYGSTEYET